MTPKQAIAVKQYAEGAYQSLKQDVTSDAVWIDMLMSYSYESVMAGLKRYISAGNVYPPNLGTIIKARLEIVQELTDEIIAGMASDGLLDDTQGDAEVMSWNRSNRIKKAHTWVAECPRTAWPEFFRTEYERRERIAEQRLLGPSSTRLIGQ